MSRMSDLDLAQNGYRGVGWTEPTTSRDAARSMESSVAELQRRVLVAIRAADERGLTSDECATAMGVDKLSIRPRFTELGPKGLGLIVETGARRANDSGRAAKAWRIK